MKILHLSTYGDGADLALDARRWGNEVKLWIQDPKRRHTIWEGMIDKVDTWKDALSWCDFVFTDANGMDDIMEQCVKFKPTFNYSTDGDKLESDRMFARELMESVGMKPLTSETFKKIPDAIKYIRSKKQFIVSKVLGGDADSEDITISEIESGEDAISMLERFEDSEKKYDEVEIEKRVFGIEQGCAGYYNYKTGWIGKIELNWQHKEFANGRPGTSRGVGPITGETGTLNLMVEQDHPFFLKTLKLFEPYFKKIKLRAEIDIGCIINEKGEIVPIEFTKRKGYPDCFLRRSLTKTPEPDLYYAIASGKEFDYQTLSGFGMAVVLMVPGFPYQESVEEHSYSYPVFGYSEDNFNQHLMEVTKGKRGIEIAKGQGYAAVVSGRGESIELAQQNTYWELDSRNPNRLYIPKSFYRTDIGNRVISQKTQLMKFGYLREADFG